MRPRDLVLVLLLSLPLAPGCAEMREPLRPVALPAGIAPAGAGGDPAVEVIRAAAEGFADQGRGLAGRPAEAAQAAARLEYLAAAIPAGGRWAPMSPSVGFTLQGARQELRGALGTREDASPDAVVEALAAAAAAALRGSDRASAGRALSPRLFLPGGAETRRGARRISGRCRGRGGAGLTHEIAAVDQPAPRGRVLVRQRVMFWASVTTFGFDTHKATQLKVSRT